MIGKKIISEKAITLSETKALLEKRAESDDDINYEQKICLDYLSKLTKLSSEKSRKIAKGLVAKSEKIKPDIAVKIVDLLPKNEDDVRAIFAKQRFTLTKEEISDILALIPKK